MDKQSPHLAFTITKPPSYLRELWQSDENILLIHRKKPKSTSGVPESEDLIGLDATDNDLELTGCPLNVDLHEDTCTSLILDRPTSWTSAESKHFPIKLEEARTLINNITNHGWQMEGGDVKSLPIFCVCDGNNKKNVILLGMAQTDGVFKRIQVSYRGYFNEDSSVLTVASMRNEHVKISQCAKLKVYTTTRSVFELYGFDMQNCGSLEKYEEIGCILVELISFSSPQQKPIMKMMLQSVIGHNNSILNGLWQQLSLIENCIKLHKSPIQLADAQVGFKSDDLNDLLDKLYVALKESSVIYKFKAKEMPEANMRCAIENLRDLREIYVSDRIWDVLKECDGIEDLQSCLELIIETIAYDNSVRVCISDEDRSILGHMIAAIYNKTFIVPNVSHLQSLEIFIDLGIQKLFRDYTCLINYFGFVERDKLASKWKDLLARGEKDKTDLPTRTMSSNFHQIRTTNIREHSALPSLHISSASTKLSFLTKLHTLLEFVNVVEQHNCGVLSSAIVNNVAIEAYGQYVAGDQEIRIVKQLLTLNVALKSSDVNMVENLAPITWQMSMKSADRSSETCTVFHKSGASTFPECICNSFLDDQEDDFNTLTTFIGPKMHLFQLNSYSNNI